MSGWVAFAAVLLINVTIYAILALGLNMHYGMAGLLNFGHVGFFAAGGFTSALTTLPRPGSPDYTGSYEVGLGLPIPVGLLMAGAAGALLAALVGLTAVRLAGHYLAIVTFAMAEILSIVLENEEWLTRGQFGISVVPRPLETVVDSRIAYLWVYLAVAVLVLAVLLIAQQRLSSSPFGRALRGVREDEVAARSLGKNANRLKLQAFVIGGFAAGIAGGLAVHHIGAVHVGMFVPIITFNVWLAVLLGGVGNNYGVVVGAAILVALRESTRFLAGVPGISRLAADNPSFIPSLRFVIIGILLIVVVRWFPRGVLPEKIRPARTGVGVAEPDTSDVAGGRS